MKADVVESEDYISSVTHTSEAHKGPIVNSLKETAMDGDGDSKISIADMILETVSNHFWETNLPGFIYSDEYQMFYNPETGYYYDQNSSLFYHPSTRCYYIYDENTANFLFHSRLPAEHHWSSKKAKKRALFLHGESYLNGMSQDEVDVFECLYSIVTLICGNENHSNNSSKLGTTETDTELLSEDEIKQFIEEERIEFPPCIRLVSVNGDLHVITIDGASIGFGSQFDICLDLPSKLSTYQKVAEVQYRSGEDAFVIKSLLDNFPLYLRGCLLAKDVTNVLLHNDECIIGDNLFHVHIHHGTNTCNGCEPGLIAARKDSVCIPESERRLTIEEIRRRKLKALKAEYGLLGEEYERRNQVKNWNSNRSVGFGKKSSKALPSPSADWDNSIYPNCLAKPVPGSSTASVLLCSQKEVGKIDKSNKGYKLLCNLGWTEGRGLGKNYSGITQPVNLNGKVRYDKAGLGLSKSELEVKPKSEKLRILEITRQRFNSALTEEQ